MSLRTVIVGTGGIAQEHLAFVDRSAAAELVGVCDLSAASARFAAERFGAATWSVDLDELLATTAPDVVHVLTPAATHVPIASRCLEAGAHVIVEKPIATTADDLRALLAVGARTGRQISEDHNYLFNRGIARLAELADSGSLGEVTEVDVRMALDLHGDGPFSDPAMPHPIHQMPAGAIHDVLTHLAYLALRFVPGPYEQVTARWRSHLGGALFRYDDLDALAIVGRGHVRIRFSAATWPGCLSVMVRGSEGQAETELFQPSSRVVVSRPGGEQLSSTVNHLVNGASLVGSSVRNLVHKVTKVETPYHGLHRFLDRTYAALLDGTPLPVGADEMLAVATLIDQLLDEANRL